MMGEMPHPPSWITREPSLAEKNVASIFSTRKDFFMNVGSRDKAALQ